VYLWISWLNQLQVILDPVELAHEVQNKPILDVLHRSKEQRFAFDKIFSEESQETVMKKLFIHNKY